MALPDEHASVHSGERLRRARKARDLTMSALASATGCSTTTVWRWENEDSVPQRRLRAALADALGVQPGVLNEWLGIDAKTASSVVFMRDLPKTNGDNPQRSTGWTSATETGEHDLKDPFLEAVVEGLRTGHVTGPAWARTAASTAHLLGLEWHIEPS